MPVSNRSNCKKVVRPSAFAAFEQLRWGQVTFKAHAGEPFRAALPVDAGLSGQRCVYIALVRSRAHTCWCAGALASGVAGEVWYSVLGAWRGDRSVCAPPECHVLCNVLDKSWCHKSVLVKVSFMRTPRAPYCST